MESNCVILVINHSGYIVILRDNTSIYVGLGPLPNICSKWRFKKGSPSNKISWSWWWRLHPWEGLSTQKTMCPRLLGGSRLVSMVASDSPNRWQVAYNHPIGNIYPNHVSDIWEPIRYQAAGGNSNIFSGWWFQFFLNLHLYLGKDSHFDSYFSNGLVKNHQLETFF